MLNNIIKTIMTTQKTKQQQLKDIIRKEYVKCASDPEYFLIKYCTIEHRQLGKIPFVLYPFQRDTLQEFLDRRFTIVLKARQLGLSSLVAGYALHTMLFGESKLVLVIATKQDTAKNLVTKVKVMYDNLPSWLQEPVTERNKLSLKLKNDSVIVAEASSDQAGRSHAATLLILDEAAFVPKIDTIWAAASQTMATGGSCIALSTPNGHGGWFHKKWIHSGDGTDDGSFFPIKLHWSVHPDRDEKWRAEQDVILGKDLANQECECLGGDSSISIRNSITGEIRTISLQQLYGELKC